jgi:branched-chain amino acid transport system substrate-binding protein
VAEQLPDSNPVKKPAMTYKTAYEKAYGGQVSTFGGHMWDAGLLLANAMPEALKKGQPGTPAFRKGLRDAMETTTNLAISHGVMNMNAKDHLGLDQRSRVMVEIEGGKWKLQN